MFNLSVAQNKRNTRQYDISKTLIAGMVLKSWQVLAIRQRRLSLQGAFIYIQNKEVFCRNISLNGISNIHIKLLLHSREIIRFESFLKQKNTTSIPIEVGRQGKYFKMLIGYAKPLKKYDIREREKEKTIQRERNNIEY